MIQTLNGKPDSILNEKTFGFTITDRKTDQNIIQKTFLPPKVDGISTSIQSFEYVLGNSIKSQDSGTTPAISSQGTTLYVSPDLTLTTNKHYQLTATISIILRPTNSSTYVNGIWSLSAGAKDTSLLGLEGYTLKQISVDNSMSTYLPDLNITLSISSNKFKIMAKPILNISYSADLLVNAKIIVSSYSNTV